jgi:hypothetical protein
MPRRRQFARITTNPTGGAFAFIGGIQTGSNLAANVDLNELTLAAGLLAPADGRCTLALAQKHAPSCPAIEHPPLARGFFLRGVHGWPVITDPLDEDIVFELRGRA